MRLSGSVGDSHSSLETFLSCRFLSNRRSSSSVGFSTARPRPHQPREVLLPILARVACGRCSSWPRWLPAWSNRRPPSCPASSFFSAASFSTNTNTCFVHLQRQPLCESRDRLEWSGVVFVERNAQELRQRAAVAAPPGDAPLRVDPLEVADQQHAEVDARRDRFAADPGGVVRLAQRLRPFGRTRPRPAVD